MGLIFDLYSSVYEHSERRKGESRKWGRRASPPRSNVAYDGFFLIRKTRLRPPSRRLLAFRRCVSECVRSIHTPFPLDSGGHRRLTWPSVALVCLWRYSSHL